MATAGGEIPKIIHQIWLGNAPQPKEWMDTVRSFAKENGYQYRLWKESDIDSLNWDSVPGLRKEYNTFSKEIAGRADIVRLLFLYQFGGIYIDADSVVMKPSEFAAFLERNPASVFFGWENLTKERTRKLGNLGPGLTAARRLVANGLIGAKANHAFIKKLLHGIIINSNKEGEKAHAWRRVGPLYVTRAYMQSKKKFPDVKIYPMKYFYPRHWGGITDPELHKKVKIPKESMLFQYGYSTNSFDKIFKARNKTRKSNAGHRDQS
jgi:mannosyltransferase OCH1-like enzyme